MLEWASVGPTEKETLSKIAKGNAIQRKGPDGGIELLAFQVKREEEKKNASELYVLNFLTKWLEGGGTIVTS